jgi:hypothetical protein
MALVHPAGFANYFFATTGTMLIRIRTDADSQWLIQRRNGCIRRGMILALVHDKQKEKKHGHYKKT